MTHRGGWAVQALSGIPVQFLRIVGIILFWVLTLLSGTERAKARRWSNQYMQFGPDVSPITSRS